MSGPIGYYSDAEFFHHDAGYGHPERAARLKAVEAVLIVAMTSFYRGGTFVPTLAVITDLAG